MAASPTNPMIASSEKKRMIQENHSSGASNKAKRKTSAKTSRLYHALLWGLLVVTLQYARLYSRFQSVDGGSVVNDETLSLTPLEQHILRSNPKAKPSALSGRRSNTTVTQHENTMKRIVDPRFQSFERYGSFPTQEQLTSSCPPRLEFLHIPKTAGTAIEQSAYRQANIAWGGCKFHLNYGKKPWSMCPQHLQTSTPLDQWPSHQDLDYMWHVPLHWLEESQSSSNLTLPKLPSDPYMNVATWNASLCRPQEQEVHFFAVVRNPYDRAVSEYYYRSEFFKGKHKENVHNPRFFNEWLKNWLRKVKEYKWNTRQFVTFTYWIPQSEYIVDQQGQRRVRHLLRYEALDTEFPALMKKYGLNITLDDAALSSKSGTTKSRMGPQHMSDPVRGLLERYFANDFALGPYPFYEGPGLQNNSSDVSLADTPSWSITNSSTVLGPKVFERFQSFPTTKELGSPCPPRLLLLHIPKTGGSTIERTAFQQANITWGCCHFHLNYGKKPWAGLCPLNVETPTSLDQWPKHKNLRNLWHYPLHWLETNEASTAHQMPSNPYLNLVAGTESLDFCPVEKRDMHFFAVVRDPYARAISEFYYQAGFARKRKIHVLEDRTFMNRWIAEKLQSYPAHMGIANLSWTGKMLHWIPQSEFIFDDQGRRRVRYVLKFENLTAEFNELVQRYHLNMTLLETKYKSGNVPPSSRLGPGDLNEEVRDKLEQHFARDFALGQYPLFRP